MTSIPLLLSEQHECSYFNDRTAQSAFIHPAVDLTPAIYSQLLSKGFRRSVSQVYSPHCFTCQDCIAVRVPVNDFIPSRNQKRILKKNQDTKVHIRAANFEARHYRLYLLYQQTRHAGSSMADTSPEDYMNFLATDWCDTWFVEFEYQGKLAAIAIMDKLPDSISAVYTFFDPDLSHLSLGNYAVLWQILHSQHLNLKWVYLGFWISDCRKMSYKNKYRPIQAFVNEQWLTFPKGKVIDISKPN